jgi:hypothetical protein
MMDDFGGAWDMQLARDADEYFGDDDDYEDDDYDEDYEDDDEEDDQE